MKMSYDLNVNGKVIHIIRNWSQIPGSDYRKVFEYAFLKTLHLDNEGIGGEILNRSKDGFIEEEARPYREMFIESWQRAEACLLTYPVPKRASVNLEEELA